MSFHLTLPNIEKSFSFEQLFRVSLVSPFLRKRPLRRGMYAAVVVWQFY
jgi:hypothetical protein